MRQSRQCKQIWKKNRSSLINNSAAVCQTCCKKQEIVFSYFILKVSGKACDRMDLP